MGYGPRNIFDVSDEAWQDDDIRVADEVDSDAPSLPAKGFPERARRPSMHRSTARQAVGFALVGIFALIAAGLELVATPPSNRSSEGRVPATAPKPGSADNGRAAVQGNVSPAQGRVPRQSARKAPPATRKPLTRSSAESRPSHVGINSGPGARRPSGRPRAGWPGQAAHEFSFEQ